MRRIDRRAVALMAAVGTCVALSGCVPQGLAFRVDDRLTIITPEDRSTVSLPVTLEWEVTDFDVSLGRPASDDAGYFAVFVDQATMPPGEPLSWLARKDNSCRASDGCPDAEYLAARGIYTTVEKRLVLNQLPRTGNDDDRRERHRAIVVLLDSSGTRIGESAFEIAFDLERIGPS